MSSARLAVMGNPVEHSLSPDIHQQFGEMTGIELSYEKILVPEGKFSAVAAEFMQSGTGFNITVPCKHDAWQFVDEASDKANLARAANTVSRAENGRLMGNTTDGGGLIRDITGNLDWGIAGRRVLVIGAGGAVSGVLSDLLAEDPVCIHLYNRTTSKAAELGERFDDHRLSAAIAGDLETGYDLVINGTSAGLSGDDVDLPGKIISDDTRCYDMIYGPGITRFNSWCRDRAACEVSDGLGMLVEQAALAFEIWFGVLPSTAPVIESMRASLDAS